MTDNAVTKYYAIAGMMVAMNDGSGLASTSGKNPHTCGRAVEVAEARLKLRRLTSPKSTMLAGRSLVGSLGLKYLLTDHREASRRG